MAFAASEQIMMGMKGMKRAITVKGRGKAKEVVSYSIMFTHRFSFSEKRKTLTEVLTDSCAVSPKDEQAQPEQRDKDQQGKNTFGVALSILLISEFWSGSVCTPFSRGVLYIVDYCR